MKKEDMKKYVFTELITSHKGVPTELTTADLLCEFLLLGRGAKNPVKMCELGMDIRDTKEAKLDSDTLKEIKDLIGEDLGALTNWQRAQLLNALSKPV